MLRKKWRRPIAQETAATQSESSVTRLWLKHGRFGVELVTQDSNLDRILDIPLMLSAQLGNTRMLIKDLLAIRARVNRGIR